MANSHTKNTCQVAEKEDLIISVDGKVSILNCNFSSQIFLLGNCNPWFTDRVLHVRAQLQLSRSGPYIRLNVYMCM